jgi:hypothetical protein
MLWNWCTMHIIFYTNLDSYLHRKNEVVILLYYGIKFKHVLIDFNFRNLLHINTFCQTPEKMAVTLLDYLFPREVLAVSNLSGKGKHRKRQLDPLMVLSTSSTSNRCNLHKQRNLLLKSCLHVYTYSFTRILDGPLCEKFTINFPLKSLNYFKWNCLGKEWIQISHIPGLSSNFLSSNKRNEH